MCLWRVILNRALTKALKTDKTPYEIWHNRKPVVKHIIYLKHLLQSIIHLI